MAYDRDGRIYDPYGDYRAFDPQDPARNPQTSPHFREGQQEYDDPGALRWGDADTINTVTPASRQLEDGSVTGSKQLVRTSVARPVVWLLQFNLSVATKPAGVPANVLANFEVTIGSGQSQTTLIVPVTLIAPLLTPVMPPPQIMVPASEVQVLAKLAGGNLQGNWVIQVACMAAPYTRWFGKIEK